MHHIPLPAANKRNKKTSTFVQGNDRNNKHVDVREQEQRYQVHVYKQTNRNNKTSNDGEQEQQEIMCTGTSKQQEYEHGSPEGSRQQISCGQ